jgi:hypothetical protein
MHIFDTNKVPRVVLHFLWTSTHLGGKEPMCHMSQARRHHQAWPVLQVRPALPGATAPAPCPSPVQVKSFPACTTWMNKIDQGNVGLIEWMKLWSLGSMGPPLRSINRHNCHSKTILSVPGRRWFIPRHRGGTAAPRGPAAPPNRRADQNRLKLPTFNRLRSKDQECPIQGAVDHRADCTSSSGHTYEKGPMRDLTYLQKEPHTRWIEHTMLEHLISTLLFT